MRLLICQATEKTPNSQTEKPPKKPQLTLSDNVYQKEADFRERTQSRPIFAEIRECRAHSTERLDKVENEMIKDFVHQTTNQTKIYLDNINYLTNIISQRLRITDKQISELSGCRKHVETLLIEINPAAQDYEKVSNASIVTARQNIEGLKTEIDELKTDFQISTDLLKKTKSRKILKLSEKRSLG